MFSLHFRPDLLEECMWPLVISDPCLVVYMCIPFAMMDYVPGSDTADVPVTALIHYQVNMHSYNQWKRHSLWKVKVDNDELSLHQAASLCLISRCAFNVQPHLYLCIINILTVFPVSESFWIAFDLHCGCSCFQHFLKVECNSANSNSRYAFMFWYHVVFCEEYSFQKFFKTFFLFIFSSEWGDDSWGKIAEPVCGSHKGMALFH